MYASEDLRNSKISYFELAVFCDQKVLQLDISMRNTVAMKIVETLDELLEQT